jgi:Fe-S oxidoreductase
MSAAITFKPARKTAFSADRQTHLSDQERVDAALTQFLKDTDFVTATYMESCIHCGLCAEVCHFYEQTGDPQYTPIWKLEPFKQVYKREAGPFSFIYKALNLKRKLSSDELAQWQHLLYDSCTVCGRCSMVCPMGIDIATLISKARHGMFQAGLVPDNLWQMARKAQDEGSPLGVTPEMLKETIQVVEKEYGLKIPLDRNEAEVLVSLSSIDILNYPHALSDIARVMNHLGYSWTLRSDGFEASNYGLLSGSEAWQKAASQKLIDAAIACKAKTVVIPECGHAYNAFRWQAANLHGQALPFRILHITELMAEGIRTGKLRVNPVNESVTFHDPCQSARRGGATEAPRTVLAALGVELHEMPAAGDLNWCCGGGGGVMHIQRADTLRYQAFEIKMQQVEQSGAEKLYTSCSDCRKNFDDCAEHFNWDKQPNSLLQLVADNLVEA